MVLIHHSRKAGAEDVLDTVSGSTAVTGSVDHTLVIKRQRLEQDGTLTLISRDFEDRKLAMRFQAGLWTLLGPADEVAKHDPDWKGDGQSDERREILATLRQEPMTPTELADALEKNPITMRRLLMKMTEAGKVGKRLDGKYAVVETVNDDVHAHTVHGVHGVHGYIHTGNLSGKLDNQQSCRVCNQSDNMVVDTSKISVNAVNGVNAVNATDRAAMVNKLVDGYKGRDKASLMAALGWEEQRFNAVKADLVAAGVITFQDGGWHVVEG